MSDAPNKMGYLNWWQGLILAVSSAIIGVVAAIYIMMGGSGGTEGPSWAMMLLRFVPHFLMLFGVLADAFTYDGVYWTGTMAGVIAVFVAPLLDMLVSGAKELPGKLMKAKESLPGSGSSGSSKGGRRLRGGADYSGKTMMEDPNAKPGMSPQTLTVTATILSYYIFDLVMNVSVLGAAGAIVAALILYGGQTVAIQETGSAAAISGIYGIAIGGSFYAVMDTWGPRFLPSSVITGSVTNPNSGSGSGSGSGGGGGAALASTNGAPGTAASCPS